MEKYGKSVSCIFTEEFSEFQFEIYICKNMCHWDNLEIRLEIHFVNETWMYIKGGSKRKY